MAVDYFLKLDGIEGESKASKVPGSIDLESFSWGETQTGTHGSGGGGGAGKVQMQDFHFVMKASKASPKLMLACAEGEHIKKAVLTCRKAGKEQQAFIEITMSDVLISSFQTSGSSHGDEIPSDQCSLNFSKIEYQYKDQKADGTLGGTTKAGYDVKAMQKV